MREYLFRGKDIKGNWHIGLLAHFGNAWYISNSAGVSTAFEVRPETVGQFTGLTDKNGERIFEGDVVHVIDTDAFGYEDDFNMEVDDMTKYDLLMILDTANEVEVIGSIHDNPELLKGDK